MQVRTAGKGVVYNLEVEEAHCYYAGGVLVSNCEAGQYLMLGAGEGISVIKGDNADSSEAAKQYRDLRGLNTTKSDAEAFRRIRGSR